MHNIGDFCSYWATNQYSTYVGSSLDVKKQFLLKNHIFQNDLRKIILDSYDRYSFSNNTFFFFNVYNDSIPLVLLAKGNSTSSYVK